MSDNLDKELEEIRRLLDDRPNVPQGSPAAPLRKTAEPVKAKGSQQVTRRTAPTKAKQRANKPSVYIVATAIVILLVLVILLVKGCSARDSFEGTWDMDGTTFYQFDGAGTGIMILPNSKYTFQYTVDEAAKTISIDFDDERASDYTYFYEVSELRLVLSGGIGNETFSYAFAKVPE